MGCYHNQKSMIIHWLKAFHYEFPFQFLYVYCVRMPCTVCWFVHQKKKRKNPFHRSVSEHTSAKFGGSHSGVVIVYGVWCVGPRLLVWFIPLKCGR